MTHINPDSFPAFERFDPGPILDEEQSDEDGVMMEGVETLGGQPDRLVVAVDFGTTFSSVAYARVAENVQREHLELDSVFCIKNYPDQLQVTQMPPREDVPTELWYNISRKQARPQHAVDVAMQDPNEESDSGSNYAVDFPFSDDESGSEQEQQRSVQDSRLHPIFWGFGVQKHLKEIDIPKDDARRLARFKLILDGKSSETDTVRTELAPIFKNLKRSKFIHQDADVIRDYLEQLLRHAKSQLQLSGAYDDNTPVEFVLCVPGVWPSRARLTMQEAMAVAAQRAAFGSLVCNSFDNLFIVSEPEAAAACVIEEDEETIYTNETIVIVDAGGGTVDAVTYQVANSLPLRLTKEVVPPSTKLCGASYINERFEKRLMHRLRDQKYLEKNGKTIKSIVEGKVIEFENGQKRVIDVTNDDFSLEPVYIDDLRPNPKRRFHQNRLNISKKEMQWIFEESLNGAADMLREQLELAKAEKHSVQKVILIGGFGQSPALQSHLRKVVAAERNYLEQEIHFLTPSIPSTVVARGAVLRALNKERGPRRVIDCSYGFLFTEVYQPEKYPAHKQTKCRTDPIDGEKYIHNTISWQILKGDELPYHQEFPTTVVHTHALNKKKLLCREEVYMSDSRHESHYRATHAMNKGAEIAGSIEVNMSFLRDLGYIQPTEPSESSAYYGNMNKRYYLVEFDLVMVLDGRNLRYEARWPPKEQLEKFGQAQRVQAAGQICVAAAFRPGTA